MPTNRSGEWISWQERQGLDAGLAIIPKGEAMVLVFGKSLGHYLPYIAGTL